MQYSITPKVIRSFMLNHFGNKGKVVSAGKEFNMNSPFHPDDDGLKFWMNLNTGLWQDFKARKEGNIIQFYSWYFKVSSKVAETELLFKSLCFGDNEEEETKTPVIHSYNRDILEIFNTFKPITYSADEGVDPLNIETLRFLMDRDIINFVSFNNMQFRYCDNPSSLYYRRAIIPFESEGKIIYFQARALYNSMFPKYLNAESDILKSSHVLYPFNTGLDYVVVTEGAMDAIALQTQRVNATSTLSCHISAVQMSSLKDFNGRIILGFDNDAPGFQGVRKADGLRKKFRMPKLEVCFPPKHCKDWGEAHIKGENLSKHICDNTQSLDDLFLESYGLFKTQ